MTTETNAIHNFLCAPERTYRKMINHYNGLLDSKSIEYLEILHCFLNKYSFKQIIMFEDMNGNLSYNSIVVAVLIDVANRLKHNEIVSTLNGTNLPVLFPFASIEDFQLDCIIIKPSQREKLDLQYFSKY